MRTLLASRGLAIVGAAAFAVAAPFTVALAQVGELPSGVTEVQAEAALQDLSKIYGQPITTVAQAKAVCNLESFMADCAEVGKRHNLYTKEEGPQVDAVLSELKGRMVEDLKRCSDETCLVGVASRLAAELARKNPAAARTLELTREKVEEKRAIVETAKELGVNITQCQAMDPDTAAVGELRGCARLVKHERVQRYLPAEVRQAAEDIDRTFELQESLAKGEYQCGNNTPEGCGNFCLNPGAEARAQGTPSIPPVCRTIAERFFGQDGVAHLEAAYSQVRETANYYERRAEHAVFTTPEGRTITDPASIGRYLEAEGERGNVAAVRRGMDYLVTQGFVKPKDSDFAVSMVERIRREGRTFDFDACSDNPESCRAFVPEEHREEFKDTAEVERIMREEMTKRGVADPARCESSPELGGQCATASRAALPRLEAIARRSPEVRGIVAGIRRNIEFTDHSIDARRRAEEEFRSQAGGILIGERTFTNFADMDAFCRANGTLCLAEAAKHGFVERSHAAERFGHAVEVQFAPAPPLPPQPPSFTQTRPDFAPQFSQQRPGPQQVVNREEALRQFANWLDNPEGPPPVPYFGQHPPPGQPPPGPRAPGEGPFPPYQPICPFAYSPRPCAPGEYREDSRDARGCVAFGACVAIPGIRETRPDICPALPTVDQCPAGQERTVTFSSPACGTYYGCRTADQPRPHICPAIPFRNAPGCYVRPTPDGCSLESCPGDPGYVPPQPPPGAAQCSDGRDNDGDGQIDYPADTGCYGPGDNDEAFGAPVGGCLSYATQSACQSAACTWYLNHHDGTHCDDAAHGQTVTSRCVYYTQETCNADVVCKWANNGCGSKAQCNDGVDNDSDGLIDYPSDPGCFDHFANSEGGGTPTPGGQRELIWNALGLRSWIRSDADSARIGELKQACANVSSGSSIWMPGSGSYSSPDFGMPDPAKCRIAASCTATQYFDGTACVASGSSGCSQYGTGWHVMADNNCYDSEMRNYRTANGTLYSCSTTPASGCSATVGTSQCSDGRDNDADGLIDYPADTGCYWRDDNDETFGTTPPPTPTSCTADLIATLGTGCHSMGNAWFNTEMTRYVLLGSSAAASVSCSTTYISGCSGGGTTTCSTQTSQSTCQAQAGCTWSGTTCQVTASPPPVPPPGTTQCSDGRDNDADGLIDYPADTGCYGREDTDEAFGTATPPPSTTCPSGYHSMVGSGGASGYCMSDSSPTTCQPSGGGATYTCPVSTTATSCSQYGTGWHVMADNNCYDSEMRNYRTANGTLYSCSTTPATGCSATVGTSQCSDGRDNDADGLIDYPADTGCYGREDTDETVPVVPTTGQCPSGYHSMVGSGGASGYCMSDSSPTTCQPSGGGATYTCPSSTTTTTQCPSGQYWSGTACVTSTTSGCSTPSNCFDSAVCASSGWYWYSGGCWSSPQTSTSTSCPSGYYWSGSSCVVSSTPPPSSTSCPSGYYLSGSTCVPSSSTICGPDQTWTGTTCVSSTTPPPSSTSCPSGQYWSGTACVTSSTPPPPPPSSTTTCPSDQYWNGTACVSPTPPPPPPPPPSSARPQDQQLLAGIAASLAEIARLLEQLR